MLILLIMSVVIGAVVAGVSGVGILFWIVAGGVFLLGLPGLIIGWIINGIGGFIHGENEYVQDRADYRELMRDLAEDERMDRYIDALENKKSNTNIYVDNRQIHFNNQKPRKKKRLT